MRRPAPLLPGFVAAMTVLTVASAGCDKSQSAARPFTANVRVEARKAVITVDVPGWRAGADYHPHFSLNGGPEVMGYTEAYTFFNLKLGAYTVRVTIADPQHRSIRGMEKQLTFTVPSE